MGILSQDESQSQSGHDNSTQSTQIRCARTFALWVINEFTKPHHYTQNRIIVSVIRMFSAGRREAATALMEHLLEYDDEHCTPAFDWPSALHLIPDAMRLEHAITTHAWKATHWAYDSVCHCALPAMVTDDGAEVFLYDDPKTAHRPVRFSLGENDRDTWFEDVWQWLVEKARTGGTRSRRAHRRRRRRSERRSTRGDHP